MPALTIEPVPVPLRQDADGTLRVGDSRVLLELIIHAFQDGATPETIVQSYDTLKLPDVYAVLAYYLTHQDEVHAYLARRDAEADALRREIEAAFPRTGARSVMLKWQDYIEERSDVMLGKPVFQGTRLTVEHVLRELGTGMSPDELLDNYPNLTPEHIRAALQYAADVVAMEQVLYQ